MRRRAKDRYLNKSFVKKEQQQQQRQQKEQTQNRGRQIENEILNRTTVEIFAPLVRCPAAPRCGLMEFKKTRKRNQIKCRQLKLINHRGQRQSKPKNSQQKTIKIEENKNTNSLPKPTSNERGQAKGQGQGQERRKANRHRRSANISRRCWRQAHWPPAVLDLAATISEICCEILVSTRFCLSHSLSLSTSLSIFLSWLCLPRLITRAHEAAHN